MSLKDICNSAVNNIGDKDCVLFMWVVDLYYITFEFI